MSERRAAGPASGRTRSGRRILGARPAAGAAAFAMLVGAASAARAADPPPSPNGESPTPAATPSSPIGLHLGARVGVGAPFGGVTKNTGQTSRSIALDVPLGLEVGVRLFDEHLRVSGTAVVAPLMVRDCAGEDARCRGHQLELAGVVSYHFTPRRTASSWVGVGLGWERLDLLYAEGGSTVQLEASGAMATAQAGFDLGIAPGLRIGPLVSSSAGKYATITLDGFTTKDFSPELHGWIVFAMRATFDP